jgi:hypothetical protein
MSGIEAVEADRVRAAFEQRVAERPGERLVDREAVREPGLYFFLTLSCASFCSR